MKTYISVFVFALILISCEHQRDVKALRELFNQTVYDSTAIQSLPLYDSLKNIIVSNIDTIFKFRNRRNFVYHGDTGKKTLQDANFYSFNYNYGGATALSYGTGPNNQKLVDDVSVENMPAYIYPSVEKLFKQLGKDNIRGFTLWKDSTMEIRLKGIYTSRINADVVHTLIWKRTDARNTDPDFFIRDTLIAPKWTYEIFVDEHRGF